MTAAHARGDRAQPRRVVVIGGGIAGLVAARACAARGATVTVLEAGPVVGGSVARHEVAGLALDAGAESFATRGGAVAALIDQLGLTGRLLWPNSAGAWLHLADRTVPMPAGGLLGIPADPSAPDVVAAIGAEAARRAQRDLTEPLPPRFAPTTLGALVRERMGQAVLDRLVSPVATGVYSTAADDLAVDAIAPGLAAALARTGSLARAVAELRSAAAARSAEPRAGSAAPPGAAPGAPAAVPPAKPGSAAGGLRGGMWTLVDALAGDLRGRGARIATGARATSLARTAGGWEVSVAAAAGPADRALAAPLRADTVIVAAGQPDAVRLLRAALSADVSDRERGDAGPDAIAPAAQWPAPTRVDLATLVLDAPDLDAAPRGTGLLVAEDAHGDVAAKALTHATAKWPWLAEQAGPGRHVVRLSYGQSGHPGPAAGIDDAALRALALRDAATLLGVPLDAAQIVGFARSVWTNAVSLASPGQAARVRAVRDAVAGAEGLEVAGAWLAGTGMASVIPDALAAASRTRI
ncbi:protoporphyrinogen oxidase [Microbacterium kribbense]|uniref:Protoporphyrinogen oxidase n=1 Tax=Microbacterium kribbense TaxID=433645 RepID=A0ABP7G477_9MICO